MVLPCFSHHLVQSFKKHDVFVVSDEIWADVALNGHKHIPLQAISEDARNRTIADGLAVLLAPFGAVQEEHVGALGLGQLHAIEVLLDVVAGVVDVPAEHLAQLVHPLVALRLVSAGKGVHGVTGLTRECIGYENGVLGGVISALNVICSQGDKVLVHSHTSCFLKSSMARSSSQRSQTRPQGLWGAQKTTAWIWLSTIFFSMSSKSMRQMLFSSKYRGLWTMR